MKDVCVSKEKGIERDAAKEGAKRKIANKVYQASFLYEQLELAGKISGNAHHIMQELSRYAQELIDKYWIDQED